MGVGQGVKRVEKPGESQYEVRQYQPQDRERVRWLCCQTGFLGQPIDPIFEDRELFADFLTAYYTDAEPEGAFVLVKDGEVVGYLIGSRLHGRHRRYQILQFLRLLPRVLLRYPRYNRHTRGYLHWLLGNARKEVPAAPDCPHFHINLLPEAKSIPMTRELMNRFMEFLIEHGEERVHGQIVTFDQRRTTRLFERYGFRLLNRSEITKYRALHPAPVYLCTVEKDLRDGRLMSGKTKME